MVYLEIQNQHNSQKREKHIAQLNKHLKNPQTKVFILFYMEGCGPCNQTRPEWAKLKNVMKDDCVIAAVDHELFKELTHIQNEPTGFPTMRYITNAGKIQENYEDSDIPVKDRTIDSFVQWIHSKKQQGGKNRTNRTNRTNRKNRNKKTRRRRR